VGVLGLWFVVFVGFGGLGLCFGGVCFGVVVGGVLWGVWVVLVCFWCFGVVLGCTFWGVFGVVVYRGFWHHAQERGFPRRRFFTKKGLCETLRERSETTWRHTIRKGDSSLTFVLLELGGNKGQAFA
jgi:hypothetical protein